MVQHQTASLLILADFLDPTPTPTTGMIDVEFVHQLSPVTVTLDIKDDSVNSVLLVTSAIPSSHLVVAKLARATATLIRQIPMHVTPCLGYASSACTTGVAMTVVNVLMDTTNDQTLMAPTLNVFHAAATKMELTPMSATRATRRPASVAVWTRWMGHAALPVATTSSISPMPASTVDVKRVAVTPTTQWSLVVINHVTWRLANVTAKRVLVAATANRAKRGIMVTPRLANAKPVIVTPVAPPTHSRAMLGQVNVNVRMESEVSIVTNAIEASTVSLPTVNPAASALRAGMPSLPT